MNWNEQVFLFFFSFAHQRAWFDFLIVFFAQYFAYVLVVCFLLFLYFMRDVSLQYRILLETFCAVFLSRGIVTELIRFFYVHSRPFVALSLQPLLLHETSSSFPSGHATFFFALAGVIFLYNRKWGSFFVVAAILNSVARVMAGVHWPADIGGGIVVSLLCVACARYATAFFYRVVLKRVES